MAPVPPNLTSRVFVDYTTGRREHTFQVRFAPGITPAALDAGIRQFLNTLQTVLPTTWRVLRTRAQFAGTSISIPIALPLTSAFVGTQAGGIAAVNEPREVTFVGRTDDQGRRAELSLYGLNITTPDDYRIEEGADGPITAAIGALRAGGTNLFIGIDSERVNWYGYANVNFNSYWETRARRG